MSAITVTKTAEDSASKALHVSIPVDRVEEATTKAVRQYAKRARLSSAYWRPFRRDAFLFR